MLHATSEYNVPCDASLTSFLGVAFNCAIRLPIPIFLMLGGYFFLSKLEEDPRGVKTLAARVRRLGVPTLIWTAIYLAPVLWSRWREDKPLFDAPLFFDWLYLGKPGAGYHLWYLYALVVLEPLATALERLRRRVSKRIFLLGTSFWFLIGAGETFYAIARQDGGGKFWFGTLGVMMTPYYFWGKELAERLFTLNARATRRVRIVAALAFLVAVVVMIALCYRGGYDYARSRFLPHAPLYAFGLFALVATCPARPSQTTRKRLETASKLTMSVYLSHVLILAFVSRTIRLLAPQESFPRAVVVGLATLAASYAFAALLVFGRNRLATNSG